MALTLHFHPLASFCWKVLIALYENGTPFDAVIVDLGDERSRAAFLKLWPLGKMPVLVDTARNGDGAGIEHHHRISRPHTIPGRTKLIPADLDLGRDTRLADRFYDLYVHEPMQKIVGDRLRAGARKIRSASSRRVPHWQPPTP